MSTVRKIHIGALKPETYFDDSLWLDAKFLLLTKESPVTESLIKNLQIWGFHEIITKGTMIEPPPPAVDDGNKEGESPPVAGEDEELGLVRTYYTGLVQYIQDVYEGFRTGNELNLADITERTKEAIEIIKKHKFHMMRLVGESPNKPMTYFEHTAKIAMIAIFLGEALKLPRFSIVEIGIAGLLHKIGLTRIPPQISERIYASTMRLTDAERRVFSSHPTIGMKLLHEYSVNRKIIIAPEILTGIAQHSEKENGTGFPNGIAGKRISQAGKILAVANGFNAKLAKRPNRNGLDGHTSMIMMLREMGTLYDERIVKALLVAFSLYPPGTYVTLSDESVGVVVGVNPQAPKSPIVRVMFDKNLRNLREEVIVNTMDEGSQTVSGIIPVQQSKLLDNRHADLSGE